MKSLQYQTPKPITQKPLSVVDVKEPIPKDDEILIHIHSCGICRTDLHVIEGELPPKKSPLTPGHQIVGVIEKVGCKVSTHRQGDRVGVAWLNLTCGKCEYCLRGDENLCVDAKFTGYDVDGGFAEYIAVHENFAYPIQKGLLDEMAAPLLCAGIIGYRALRLSGIKSGERLGLFGFGASAHITIQVAQYWNCEIYVFSRNEQHRKLAE